MKKESLPLGIAEKAFKDFDKSDKNKFKVIAKYDLSFLIGEPMYRQGVTNKRFHIEAIEELKKFLSIKVIAEPHPLGMFSPIVAAAWHSFILNTIEYEKFCKKTYGKTIHHVPGGGASVDNKVWISIYREWFNDFPVIWTLDVGGTEIPRYLHALNVEGTLISDDLDSDDGQYVYADGSND